MNAPLQNLARACRSLAACAVAGLVAVLAVQVAGQSYYGLYQPPKQSKPFDAIPGLNAGQSRYMNPTRDLYNKYFYRSPAVSPYLNLDRPATAGTTAYHTWVLPEQKRRQRTASHQSAYGQPRNQAIRTAQSIPRTPPRAGSAGYGRKPSGYYQQWYAAPRTR